jgi:hypothetical protein
LTAPDHRARISELKTRVENLADGIASGMFKPSPTLGGKLGSAEAELEQLQAADATVTKTPEADVSMLLANLPELALRAVDQLGRTLASGRCATRQDGDKGTCRHGVGRGRRSGDQAVQRARGYRCTAARCRRPFKYRW